MANKRTGDYIDFVKIHIIPLRNKHSSQPDASGIIYTIVIYCFTPIMLTA